MPHTRLSAWSVVALLVASSIAAESQTPIFRIAGQVVRSADDRPISGASVSIFDVQHSDREVACITGEKGEFSFPGVPAGKYSLQTKYHGWPQSYKQLDEYSTAIAVGVGQDTEHIVFALDAPVSITGSVIDEADDPVRGASVYLFGKFLYRGIPETGLKATVSSDTEGKFRFPHVLPGTYYVAVSGRPWYAGNGSGQLGVHFGAPPAETPISAELDVAYPLTYYASATTPEGASPLRLEAGARAEIQFRLQAVPAVHVVFGGVEKKADQQILESLSQGGPGGTLIAFPAQGVDGGMAGIAPGDYIVSANLFSQNRTTEIGSQTVSLSGDSTVDLKDAIRTSVSGKVVLQGGVPQSLAVLLENSANGIQAFNVVATDGTFSIPNLSAGHYNLRLANTPELYLQRVTAQGATYAKGALEIRQGQQVELNIEAGRRPGKIEGVALRDGKAFSGAMILLLTQDFSHGNYIPRDQSDSDGTFALNWVPPGRYTLVAIEDGRVLEYANETVMAPYLAGGRTIDVPQAANAGIQVAVQPRR